MAHGREDFTLLADTNITAQTITSLAVDIIAQTIATLGVNIKAQDLAALKMDIIAQTLAVLKMDITAQTLSALKMDITAQTLSALKMDITAQTLAALKMDITAQTLSALKINITAQDLVNLVISISAQTVGIYLQPEWAAKQGIDKNFAGNASAQAFGGFATVSYTVPAGKTLYITGLAFFNQIEGAANAGVLAHAIVSIAKGATVLCSTGGDSGGSVIFSKPLVLVAAEVLTGLIVNNANVNCNLTLTIWGYEL